MKLGKGKKRGISLKGMGIEKELGENKEEEEKILLKG